MRDLPGGRKASSKSKCRKEFISKKKDETTESKEACFIWDDPDQDQ